MKNNFRKSFLFVITAIITLNAHAGKLEDKLHEAIEQQDIEKVEKWIDKGADIEMWMEKHKYNDKGEFQYKHNQTALMCALSNNYYDIAKLLIEKGADLNEGSPISYVVYSNPEFTKLLLAKGADINYRTGGSVVGGGFTQLIKIAGDKFMSQEDKLENMKLFIEYGADINLQCDWGRTALYQAAWFGDEKECTYLLEKGADPNIADKNGRTPLSVITTNDHNWKGDIVATAKLLIDKGADINALDKKGMTPLMHAIDDGNNEIASLLLDLGADATVYAESVDLLREYNYYRIDALRIAKNRMWINDEVKERLRKLSEAQQ